MNRLGVSKLRLIFLWCLLLLIIFKEQRTISEIYHVEFTGEIIEGFVHSGRFGIKSDCGKYFLLDIGNVENQWKQNKVLVEGTKRGGSILIENVSLNGVAIESHKDFYDRKKWILPLN